MKIESIRLRNFKAFRDVHLKDMPSFLVVVGANGSGKSTLFDVFGFLHDCLKGNVRQALDKRGRFREVLSRGCDPTVDSILIELQYRMEITGVERLVTYSIEIGEENGAPIVQRELLRYKRGRYGSPYHFLNFSKGEGYAITNEEDFKKPDEELDRESQKVAPDTLAIKGLGQFERFKAANAFRQLIENWHVSDFHINAARGRKEATGDSEHLSESGDNLPLVAQYMNERHQQVFRRILDIMARRVPGVASVEPKRLSENL
ncbi:AAA family ATPase, partial [Xanthomonas oryzae]